MDLKIFEHVYDIEANLKTKFGAESNLSLNVPCLRFGAGTDPPAALDPPGLIPRRHITDVLGRILTIRQYSPF